MNSLNNRALIVFLLMPFLFSCSTYRNTMSSFYGNLQNKQFDKAINDINNNKLLKKERNQLLYNMELGKLSLLNNNPEKSNEYLNAADALLESNFKNFKDVAKSNLVNPMTETYRGEEFEKFMVNYYKALNYISLNKTEDAVVEAKRIGIAANRLAEKCNSKESKYCKDPFILNFQGMLYEMSGDWNNAFISYRNAADIYLSKENSFYGVSIPSQLKQDLLFSANMMGFTDEQTKYEGLFQEKFFETKRDSASLILFLEEGNCPIKDEISINVVNSDGLGFFQFPDQYGQPSTFLFDYNQHGLSRNQMNNIRAFRIALPVSKVSYHNSPINSITVNDSIVRTEVCENFNTLAVKLMDERYLSEIGKAIIRFCVKKAIEIGAEKIAEGAASNSSSSAKNKEEKEKKDHSEAVGKAVGFLVNMVNTITEKADTRSWLSLPAYISYVRIPLKPGENNIKINNAGKSIDLKVNGSKGLQIKSLQL